jgi:hypothetical protein
MRIFPILDLRCEENTVRSSGTATTKGQRVLTLLQQTRRELLKQQEEGQRSDLIQSEV